MPIIGITPHEPEGKYRESNLKSIPDIKVQRN